MDTCETKGMNVRGTKHELQAKRIARGLSILMLGAVLRPIIEYWRKKPRDSFPLSPYPMFSAKRTHSAKVTYVLGFDAEGTRHLLPYLYVGTGGLNQVRRQLRRNVSRSKAETVCQAVAAKIARRSSGPYRDLVTVQIVTGAYRLDDYFKGITSPVSEQVHASCDVKRERV